MAVVNYKDHEFNPENMNECPKILIAGPCKTGKIKKEFNFQKKIFHKFYFFFYFFKIAFIF